MKAPETVVLSQSALESTMDAIEAHLRAKDPERFNALPWREQAEKDPEGFAEMSEIIRIAVSVTRPPPLQSGEIGELVEKAKVLRLIGDAHRTQDYAGRTHGFIYNAGETVPLGAVVIAAEGCEQEVGRARLDLIVAAVNALPTLLATITALQAELASARKVDVEALAADTPSRGEAEAFADRVTDRALTAFNRAGGIHAIAETANYFPRIRSMIWLAAYNERNSPTPKDRP